MYIIKKTDEFMRWLTKLRDLRARALVYKHITRMEIGSLGVHKSIGDSISELKIDYGPGYRLYYTKKNDVVILLLIGGDKSTQQKDIEKAKRLAKEYGV